VDRARELLGNERLRAEIAAAGARRTLEDHTIANRVATIDSYVREALGKVSRVTTTSGGGP
jgi:spore maturation protein CgeB